MSNFLLRDPNCVLIHIPKTGGSTIREGLWGGRYVGPVFGAIPSEWAGYLKFAFVRNPLDRLVSAWADFSGYRRFSGSIDEFIEVVMDERVIYDERRTTLAERIRHHTIPQTHRFNCLSCADVVGRFEDYEKDLGEVLRRVGFAYGEIPRIRSTGHQCWRFYLTKPKLSRASCSGVAAFGMTEERHDFLRHLLQ